MHVLRRRREFEVWAPAKVNLFLEVLSRRDDGYHEIETLMCPVDLYDTLYFRDEPRGRVTLECEFAAGVRQQVAGTTEDFPEGSDNIVVRAIELLRRDAGVTGGAALRLVKRIPVAAGLAGGSSDAAAALITANIVWGLGYSVDALRRIGAQLGSDVPFFFGHGAAVCRGRGERIEPVNIGGTLHLVVVRPPDGLLTSDVYAACRPATRARPVAPVVKALQEGATHAIGSLLHNRLQGAAEGLSRSVTELRRTFERLDLAGHQMSGSGTSYFGICRHAREARRLRAYLEARGIGTTYAVASHR